MKIVHVYTVIMYTVEPPNNGHIGSGDLCPLLRGCPYFGGAKYVLNCNCTLLDNNINHSEYCLLQYSDTISALHVIIY